MARKQPAHAQSTYDQLSRQGMAEEVTARDAKKAKKGNRSVFWTIILVISIIVFVVALFFAVRIVYEYQDGKEEYETLADGVLVIPSEDSVILLSDITVDWDTLYATNSDVVAWVYMPGTLINYPVCYSGDDYYYLKHTFTGVERSEVEYGTPFLEGANSTDLSDDNNIIFGHAMNNGTMFGAIYLMAEDGTFNENRDIYILTPEGNLHLRTFAYVQVEPTEVSVLTTNFSSDDERTAFIQDKIDRSLFVPDDAIPDASDMDTIFTFITCTDMYASGRALLYAYVYESTIDYIEGTGQVDPNTIGDSTLNLVDGLGF